MGKAARKRHRGQNHYLAAIAASAPEVFAEKWEMRIDSWLREIRLEIAEWQRGGNAAKERVFMIVDAAMETLSACGQEAYGKYAKATYETLCNECCVGVADTIDPRLYRLSNINCHEYQHKMQAGPAK